MDKIKISVIIVNYNVRDFLEQALLSVGRALQGIPSQVIVVDNASVDGSVQMLKERFPKVELLENTKNTGFSAANNQGLDRARGEFIVLLNPDTVVQEDTFSTLLSFFEKNPRASAATCKILNPDGTFSVDCRHSIPGPATAFWKMIGLARLFPKSRVFGKYNLTYLDENETYKVEAISGSFMMMRAETVRRVGRLDEDFFMYCEDIDYCQRINQAGGEIYYVPDSQIIHYKGESTKKNNLDYVITFNRSLYKFYKKHYRQKYIFPFKWLILLGTILRGTFVYLKNKLSIYYPLILDVLFLNLAMFLSFWLRYSMKQAFSFDDFFGRYIVINIITSIGFILSSLFFNSGTRKKYKASGIIKANMSTFVFVAALTFFFNQFAFSRFVVLISAVASPLFMGFWRFLFKKLSRKSAPGRFLLRPALIVGFDAETEHLLGRLKSQAASGLELIGLVALDKQDVGKTLVSYPVVTSLAQLPEYLRLNDIELVIFTTHNLSYASILTAMSHNRNPRVEFKIVPGHLEFIVGKSTIERLDALPLLDISYAYGKPFNRFIKRSFDFTLSALLLLLLSPLLLLGFPWLIKKGRKVKIGIPGNKEARILDYPGNRFWGFVLNLLNILSGRLSFVGAPLGAQAAGPSGFEYKAGITGLVQVNEARIGESGNRENYELHYLKNHSFFMDMEILLKSVFK